MVSMLLFLCGYRDAEHGLFWCDKAAKPSETLVRHPCGKAYHSNEANFKQLLRTHPFASNA